MGSFGSKIPPENVNGILHGDFVVERRKLKISFSQFFSQYLLIKFDQQQLCSKLPAENVHEILLVEVFEGKVKTKNVVDFFFQRDFS